MLGLNAFAEHAFASIGQGYYVLVTGNKITLSNNGAGVEVAAGARLGQIVVDDDRIAAKAIEILKKFISLRPTFS